MTRSEMSSIRTDIIILHHDQIGIYREKGGVNLPQQLLPLIIQLVQIVAALHCLSVLQ